MNFQFTPAENIETLWVVADRLRVVGHFPETDVYLIEVEVPPGSGTPPHTHASPELFWVLEGEVVFRRFGAGAPDVVAGRPGASVRIEGHVPHNYANESAAPARFAVLVEAEMLAFFREIARSEPLQPGEAPDFAAIGAAMGRHGIGMVQMAA